MSDRYATTGQGAGSALVRELRQVRPSQRQAFGVTDEVLQIWDGMIGLIELLIDEADPRGRWDRLEGYFQNLFGDVESVSQVDVEAMTAEVTQLMSQKVPDWAEDVKREGFQKFVRRAVGEASYQRLVSALQEDMAIVAVALRRAARALMPFAVALDDLYSRLPEGQRLSLPTRSDLPNSILSLMLMLEGPLDKLVQFSAPSIVQEDLPADLAFGTADQILELVDELRELVSGQSRAKVQQLSRTLGRKVQGARDALQYSADSVAQAANSLIELIDRLLRAAFSDAEVIEWVNRNYANKPGLTHESSGVVRPTKRGQVLCFVHAGASVNEPSVMHELAASALVATRTQLQKLKHADLGTEEEQEEIRELLSAVEGFLHLAIGVAWATVSDQRLDELKANLDVAT